jgi:hypothetical protein
MRGWLICAAAVLASTAAAAQTGPAAPATKPAPFPVLTPLSPAAIAAPRPVPGPRPVLVEMFVSQSCSSCPPANALLQQLAARDKWILPLSLNVTYWNNLGWQDTDSSKAATDRQFWYAALSGNQNVYTPEAVVDGTSQMVGSDRAKLTAAISAARADPAGDVPIAISGGSMVKLDVGAGDGTGQITLFGYDSRHDTHVGAGENAGETVSEANVVRSITPLGGWLGTDEKFMLPHPAGAHVALLLQAKDGSVLGLAAQ